MNPVIVGPCVGAVVVGAKLGDVVGLVVGALEGVASDVERAGVGSSRSGSRRIQHNLDIAAPFLRRANQLQVCCVTREMSFFYSSRYSFQLKILPYSVTS